LEACFSTEASILNSFDSTKIKDTATPKKSRSMTFRLDTLILDELQKEADLKELSLNVLVNQVLRRYVEWDRYESKLNMMPVPKLMLATLIDETVQVGLNSGISGIDSSRDRILKNAAKITFNLMRDSVLLTAWIA
jgi:hypothetical protein